MTPLPFIRQALCTFVMFVLVCGAIGIAAGAADETSIPGTAGQNPEDGAGTSFIPPVAGFTVDRVIGTSPFTVQFTDTSVGTVASWHWDFGDGNTSGRQHPVYTYRNAGNYTVTLTVQNSGGSTRYTLATPIAVREYTSIPDPDFTYNTSSGRLPLAVQFTDTSGGAPDAWAWDFDNDGTIDSRDQNPVCVYNRPGNYSVNLTVSHTFNTKTILRTEIIQVESRVPIPLYTVNTTSGSPPLAIRFTDASTGTNITGWVWDFDNDGTIDSRDQNPACVYTKAGNYTVNLTVTNEYGANTTAGSGFIEVTTGMIADFSANLSTGTLPLAVQFRDNSTGTNITGWAWDFNNDTVIDSTDKNPVCVYNKPGDYTVLLTVANTFGTDTVMGPGYVTVTTGMVPDFSTNLTTGTLPLAVQFTDASTGTNITGWAWDFDNDTVIDSTDKNPVCIYNRAGNYTVNLSTTNTYGTNSTVKQGLVLVSTRAPVAGFAVNTTGGIPPLAVQFSDTSSGANITGWAWDCDNDTVIDSTEQNPVCVYTRFGNYTVNLTVINEYGANTTVIPDLIVMNTGEPRARFAVNRTTGISPMVVQFKDISVGTNITGWAWDFDNNGITDSREKNPSCVYNLPGNYSINLTVTNEYGSDTVIRKGFVTAI